MWEYSKDRLRAEIADLKKQLHAYEEMAKQQALTEIILVIVGFAAGVATGFAL
jgi:hypothetical protein